MSMSGCRSSPVIREGERYCGRSTLKVQLFQHYSDEAKKFSAESCLHVKRPSLREALQPATT